ncbi:unnamed protein product [Bursaphelenchus okinawaensis]|uniref:Uncharacterized protein n=1 Tax=Bursaphelenchus okinawaensis TaxID=465554 RepID=A0A811LLG1_9BILA|nr:unnamed protein product [Bursaphelenchus okinawaensis]CAG9127768.1 unnamed protein product [Bursaphelenchus okinawaensis]
MVYVLENNEPIINHELFTHTRTVFDTFGRMLNWNQGRLKVNIFFQVFYKGAVDEKLARKMTEYIGYECCYNGEVGLDVSMSNVDLELTVSPQ